MLMHFFIRVISMISGFLLQLYCAVTLIFLSPLRPRPVSPLPSASTPPVFPIPPFQLFGVMTLVLGKIDRASEDVEQTPVDLHSLLFASLRVQQLGVFSPEVRDRSDAKLPQVFGNAWPDPGNDLKLFDRLLFCPFHCPGGYNVIFAQELQTSGNNRSDPSW